MPHVSDSEMFLLETVLIMVLAKLGPSQLWYGTYSLVSPLWCRLIHTYCKKKVHLGRFYGYDQEIIKPKEHSFQEGLICLEVSDGTLYLGLEDNTIQVWSPKGDHLHTLEGHTQCVTCIEIGPNGTVYSGSRDGTIRIWSSEGEHLRTLKVNITIRCVAVGLDGSVYLESYDKKIRIWSPEGE